MTKCLFYFIYICRYRNCRLEFVPVQEKYTKEEAKSLSVGLYVALALIAGTIFFTSQRKEIEHAESGDYYALNARFGRTCLLYTSPSPRD